MEDLASKKQEIRWVLRAQSGDREALDHLFELIQDRLYRYILSLAGEASLAQDILQEVFLLIYRKLYWLREPELFRVWSYRIASREAFKRLRKERRWSAQVRDESVLEAIPEAGRPDRFEPEMAERLPELLARLSPRSRAVIALHYLQEMTIEEVADVLGVPSGTVKSRLSYGLAALRKAVRECGYKTDNL